MKRPNRVYSSLYIARSLDITPRRYQTCKEKVSHNISVITFMKNNRELVR